MAQRRVLHMPHPVLKRPARGVAPGDLEEIARVGRDLLDTMHAGPATVGIAAPQIAEEVRITVVDCSGHPKAQDANHGLMVLVNPVVVAAEGAEVGREGCLSIPHLTANVRRATHVTVEALDAAALLDGSAGALRELRIDSVGFEARCLQHEIDHLDGILFLDRVDSLSRDVFRRKTYK
jgi:peptide deformylase